ncbi:hypothetical protein KDJ56_17695 [Brevibacillus composti]|uniref:Uncharacterized protein n=1 Tax=Brevibacillus composti TaxID=2796470 RepID=A0A7T5JN18_9BACL|nr:hypothetical protein [Brevibacillus composti]QQE73709.1 hypothetical protein JD108_17755 [Brevibacillus composti]QUO40792.1 hypothetical protein KDJ56_17695 [Brevibacillus composti]
MGQQSDYFSSDELAFLSAILTLIGSILAVLALIKERQEKLAAQEKPKNNQKR